MRKISKSDIIDENNLYEHHHIVVDPGQKPMRIDQYVAHKIAAISRNRVQIALKVGYILLDGKKVKPNYKVLPKEVITVRMPEPPAETEVLAEDIPLDIVYEDDTLLLINKPAGLVVHPATDNWTGTMLNGLVHHFEKQNIAVPGLVHRIDKDTSGLVVIPKTEEAKFHLAGQFFDHSSQRTYNALVWGEPKEDSGTIRENIARSPKDRRVMTTFPYQGEKGKAAITHYKVLERFRYVALVECKLETGRTHQIRAHFRSLGHPLFNDARYNGDKIIQGSVFSKYKAFVQNCFKTIPRQALHAKSLGFVHPKTGEWMQFESELPEDFTNVLERWRKYCKYN